jgi:hypothetical protein
MGQEMKRRNEVTSGNEEVGQTNARKEDKLAVTSPEDAIGKSSQATSVLSTCRKTKIQEGQEDGFTLADGMGYKAQPLQTIMMTMVMMMLFFQ